MSGGVVAFEGELNSIVKEYLDYNTFDKTVACFDKECLQKRKPVTESSSRPLSNHKLRNVQDDLVKLFVKGQRKDFFKIWTTHLPEALRNEDPVAQKLEFYLNIYFAIFPMKNGHEHPEDAMDTFKKYLETRGASLSQTTEFLPFYALPFVPNPRKHPSYRELFSEKWVPDLRSRLERFLTLSLQSVQQPRLFELYKGGGGRGETMDDVMDLEHRAVDAEKKLHAYIKRYTRVQADYHNLIGITADLVDSLESTVQGRPVSPEYLQHICMRLFSNQVRQSVDFTRPGTAGEVLRQSVVPPQGLEHNQAVGGPTLDYDKIKREMTSAPERQCGLLLQALRWKLTKAAPPDRDAMLVAYVNNDILGCTHKGPHRVAVLLLLTANAGVLQNYTARLFNAFASLNEGRSYLSGNPDLLRALMDSLKANSGDHITLENVLGCLQKLSLRRQLQTIMIDEGIIAWLVAVLEDNDSLSDYTLEYSVALLMNLCLRSAGKRKCAEGAHKILKVLSDLLGHDNQEIIPYVNGTLYSILAVPSVRDEAKAMGMEEILRCFIKDGQPDMNRQIEFIVKQLNKTEEQDDDADSDDEDDEDEEDQDAMEADLDKAEILKPQSGELVGDRLLNTNYIKTHPGSSRRKRVSDSVAGQEDLLRRPVTPSHMRGEQPLVHVQPRSSVKLSVSAAHDYSDDFEPDDSWPPTGRSRHGGRPHSQDVQRPHTRSGSRPDTGNAAPRPSSVSKDTSASDQVSKNLASAKSKLGSERSDMSVEFNTAFNSRPRVLRTPDVGSAGRPSSRGSPPQPKYSDSLPTSRPGSGGRQSSSPRTPRTPRTPSSGKSSRTNQH